MPSHPAPPTRHCVIILPTRPARPRQPTPALPYLRYLCSAHETRACYHQFTRASTLSQGIERFSSIFKLHPINPHPLLPTMSIPAENPLSAIALSRTISASLSTLSGPQLKNPYDAVAILAHACMLAVDFRLVGLGEDDRLGEYIMKTSASRVWSIFWGKPKEKGGGRNGKDADHIANFFYHVR